MFTSVTNAIKRISQYLGQQKGPPKSIDPPAISETFLVTKPEVIVEDLPTSSQASYLMLVVTDVNLLAFWCRLQSFRWIGVVSAFFSVLFWSLSGLSFKLNKEMHALQILMISSMFVAIVYLVFIFLFYGVRKSSAHETNTGKTSFWILLFGIPGERFNLLMRCFCGTLSLACYYTSLHYIPMSDATTIRFTSPVFIAILAHFLVHEPFGWLQLVNSIITLLGVFLIGRPSFMFKSLHPSSNEEESKETILKSDTLIGILLSLSAAITISVSMICMRKLRKTPAPLVIFWFCLCNVILGAAGLPFVDQFRWPSGWYCWLLVFMTTIFSALDQFFITLALQLENAGAVAVIQALCVVLSFVFSILILHEPLYWTSALGGTCIFLSVIVLGIAKLWQEVGYERLKSTIFHINLLHYSSSKYSFNSKLTLGTSELSVSSTLPLSNSLSKEHIPEPYLLRMAPISTDMSWTSISELDLNNNNKSGLPNEYRNQLPN